ncbi:MAG: hypothetical protein HYY24_23235 [Verrucomicrobia bacterium]|nr:hypothetical protein [Verrucomicrobiota bacterium]
MNRNMGKMKRGLMVWLVWAFGLLCSAAPAEVHLHGLSLRFQPAIARLFGLEYVLELASFADPDAPNGELSPVAGTSDYSHGGVFKMQTPDAFEPLFIQFVLNVPSFVDANKNLVPDFFEVSQAVNNVKTTGLFNDGLGGTPLINATWSRAADAKDGTCKLNLPYFGLTFNHAFELIEFEGELPFAVRGTDILGSVDLKQKPTEAATLGGPIALTRVSADHLRLVTGQWTDAINQQFPYDALDPISRDKTNYFSLFFHFQDGDPNTAYPDYDFYFLLITDPNDTDSDGIPDLSDTPEVRRPALALSRVADTVSLKISGEVGRAYEIQQAASPSNPNWTKVQSVTLTTDPQEVPLGKPASSPLFFRVKVP